MARGITPQEARLSRLMTLEDFRQLLIEWADSAAPWMSAVPEHLSADASFMNGRASFMSELLGDLHRYLPEQYVLLQQERLNHVRSELDRELREREQQPGADRRARLQHFDTGFGDDGVED